MQSFDKTSAIILKSLRYGDSSLIVHALTREFGLQSYIVKGAFLKNAKLSPAFFQNLTVLDIVISSSRGNLKYLKEVSLSKYYCNIGSDINKNAIVIFLSELLSKSIIETEADNDLYDFVCQSIMTLYDENDYCNNFILYFSMELTRHLGFYPNISTFNNSNYFDLQEGRFRNDMPSHPYYLDSQCCRMFYLLCVCGKDNIKKLPFDNGVRRFLMEAIINYYKMHVSGFKELRSYEILKMIM